MQASGFTEFIPFIRTSAIWGQSCFFVHLKMWQMAASCIPQLVINHHGGWQHLLDQFWEPSFTFGDQKSLMAVNNFLFIDMARDTSTVLREETDEN